MVSIIMLRALANLHSKLVYLNSNGRIACAFTLRHGYYGLRYHPYRSFDHHWSHSRCLAVKAAERADAEAPNRHEGWYQCQSDANR